MLITCGKCGNDVSDKALKCPKCSTPVAPLSISCPECGKDVNEQDLHGDCPHCGYPLLYFRASSAVSAQQPEKPKEPPKPVFNLECPNCGCVSVSESNSAKCPKCGFAMSPAKQPAGAGRPKQPSYSADSKTAKAKAPAKPKSRLRIIGEHLLIAVLIATVFASAILMMLRYDVFGMRSALHSVSNAEETEESLKGSFSDARLWVKHAISVVLDQLPDSPAPSASKGSEGQSR